jgi:hypothetical protein
MKKTINYLALAFIAVMLWSCHKSGDSNVTPKTTYTFTVNGNSYTETAAADSGATDVSSGTAFHILAVSGIGADGKAQGLIELLFLGSGKPAAGSYNVVGDVTSMTASQVAILAADNVTAAKSGVYSSTGKDNSSLIVAVSSSGKLSATLPSIATSGSNFDNTDPKNTVVTTVTGTVSGKFSE